MSAVPVLVNRFRENQTTKYLLTLEVILVDGSVRRGNIWFASPEPLSQALLDTAKLKHVENMKAKGVDVDPSNVIILNLIRLET